ncbi:MAG: hypothetical protein A2268_13425 [Candidatus Raymondbacteria bacterium RifOxyA12_full_50_37]|uniref:Secretion system C-terminal sorting domain-containing protein n=1 Tax=Candidatus Raymondbacteria bacterium RIFOXYD12_FULL_49_13 TaxID=1817890 RepID=A0A1F7FE22_UNCRA|nr:MAG: hypothetical protein A2268_13425 [Candidatus Raymondbacteria bacterium RifOxyA12_full_50_37]OGJ91819.1 MAG: hypothetical protein A2248_00315 [Candidatus Raymondbacteria bacterium RIFOXYA2_FULL_49_16]OGK04706.1 MAG: hypothetical protein A2519_18675 [Candidatus Raymondbacteria bacterium RIFOXYD12_FULL_49_13]OGK07909.1 MAG: hypothetical protein A2487_17375 [Candidatus Raymondbacteria bacterium RifOxyC12_full_50_8]OGP43960.1 MAG: hypothetical protein A2324_11925 [Candidatus Raymondbacteria 
MLSRIAIVAFSASLLFSQTQWEKSSQNPVMIKQNTTYDWAAIGQPACLLENDTFKMWYVAVGNPCRSGLPYTGRIAYAYSLDGVQWIMNVTGAPVLDVASAGQWDDTWLDTPEILRDAQGYKLFYFGDTTMNVTHYLSPYVGIGLAFSPDGINRWQRVGSTAVLSKGNTGEWDDAWVESPAVCYDTVSGTYLMWYTGVSYSIALQDWHCQIGLATSTNCTTWTKYAGNPVVPTGTSGTWNDKWVAVPAVIKKSSMYEMWFSAKSSEGNGATAYIGYATSSNGRDWNICQEPLFSTDSPPYDSAVEKGGPWAPDIVWNGTEYFMWYETAAGFCLAQAPMDASVNIAEAQEAFEPEVFPNPLSAALSVRYQCEANHAGFVRIFSLNGQRLLEAPVSGAGTWIGDASNLAPGAYLIRVSTGRKMFSRRIILLR